MSMIRYPYKDPKEMSAFKVIKEGDGFFKIISIKHGYSKSNNNEQYVFTFKLKDIEGNTTLYMHYMLCNEYLTENIYRICEAVGRLDLYTSNGTDPEHLKGLQGRCRIKTELDPEFDDRSVITRFIPYRPMLEGTSQPVAGHEFGQDPIPF